MAELGTVYPKETLSARRVAEGLNLSVKYLEQIMSALKASGLIRSVRGVNGGYALARPPGEITLYDIFRVLEGAPLFLDCLRTPEECPRESICATRDVWKEMNDALTAILRRTTVADLVERSSRKRQTQAKMYHI